MADAIKRALPDYAAAIRDYAGDFGVAVADMFDPEQEIDFNDPEDAGVNGEIHWIIGWVSCAALALGKTPAELVAEYAPEEDESGKRT